jgi:RNA polymerase sigma factor (TIGR02999 family)
MVAFLVLPMSDVTRILSAIQEGDSHAAEQLLPLVYEQLRKLASNRLANERPGQTLQATALVHEVYLRMVDGERVQDWDSRGHFFAAAAEAMRRILIERARRKRRHKHGGGEPHVDIDLEKLSAPTPGDDLLALDEAMTRFAAEDPIRAQLVRLRFYAGLSNEDAAKAMGIAAVTAKRYWRYARAWLHRELGRGDDLVK